MMAVTSDPDRFSPPLTEIQPPSLIPNVVIIRYEIEIIVCTPYLAP